MSLSSGGGNRSVTSRNYIGGIPRTKIRRRFDFRTTFSAGSLFPIYAEEVYPATTKSVDFGALIRSITPLGPVMDKSFLDVFFFFVPFRLVWDHWEEFIAGYNKEAWAQGHEYLTPQIKFKTIDATGEGYETDKNQYLHSFMDYLPGACDVCQLVLDAECISSEQADIKALEDKVNDLYSISALYPRSFVKIYNDWFRDENLQDELELYTGDSDEYADEFAFDLLDPAALPKAAKYHNRITSALPNPTKGPDVLIPMKGLTVSYPNGIEITAGGGIHRSFSLGGNEDSSIIYSGTAFGNDQRATGFSGGVADNVSNTIRMLRLATQTELLLARDARGGTRYVESLLSHWATHNGDATLQRSEYLGSRQIPLQVLQVTNTTQSEGSVLGNVGGQSITKDAAHYFTKSFSEHGVVIGVACLRTNLSYSSGIRKQYQRKGRFEYIWPEFRHIGDVPLYKREIELNELLGLNSRAIFGYTPYGSELREGYNYNNGLFRYKADGNLSYLTYQERYSDDSAVMLNGEFIEQPVAPVTKTLVDQTGPQFYMLCEIQEDQIIPLDPTSDPGLMDHF